MFKPMLAVAALAAVTSLPLQAQTTPFQAYETVANEGPLLVALDGVDRRQDRREDRRDDRADRRDDRQDDRVDRRDDRQDRRGDRRDDRQDRREDRRD